ncbi:MAG: hypothetical protein A3B91_04920 [Candidatus Yanofskybacteria bacterium RIFCSPHIGHO2_02_FULL_41_29]|uniref:Uncharacterized protein n=1 Tax=Candidatus Yanofskybacteria bacterium RIFCSPHIGHO2_01_FULL_41_53 TaxID=1802663 RepID=A0A1F8EGI7_9BACT|nr:MAG: hypothetical protein A2650_01530 [Candidatus Yanofskybacteria bacterium RIFCSPHIGHO2_01_FULL_41_53]OGN11163.1 MAG: hypothetical protein A3B91_04920 [Candidatus Yanofskybacteria bacterium RIFCSPHIGHO2_02_FULL_41_29]OGN16829.1 MAG: hypothetical protein A3F48_04220 [Candidatus Yanofskybacteria bacterium RIFCSPHIGHO2_12_FULL_41_9]OGN22077.1 MAG: hypothetical protein A2916_00140 [Candidatus Yanofskybacteria bacterium RIFCSPLOWO2_01_FULL_41_67]OGN28530.1 MAG: hypothetical protein A3H54_04700 
MNKKCCSLAEKKGPLPEAGSGVDKIRIGGTSEQLKHALDAHDLGSGVADCGCVVMDYRFCPCKKHGGQ